ncbi:MAG: hypothetical protein LBI91_01270 [Spirochaetaceae bacterium]|jgi:hypothetical protein|nr:hypothetical protein [Spirochaetaceae bacterium]
METTQTVPDWKAAADEIWALLRETARRQEEIARRQEETARQMEETDRRLDKQMKETDKRLDKQMRETARQQEETARQMKETDKRLDKQLGKLGNRFGEMVEHMVMPNLVTKFDELGFTFTKAYRTIITDKEHAVFAEVDAFLENGDKVMIVEIKTKPSIDDINDHIERMGKLRKHADLHHDKRVYLGAIAGVVFSDSEKNYALKKGFYVIEPSGDTFNIIEPKGAYYPHEW